MKERNGITADPISFSRELSEDVEQNKRRLSQERHKINREEQRQVVDGGG